MPYRLDTAALNAVNHHVEYPCLSVKVNDFTFLMNINKQYIFGSLFTAFDLFKFCLFAISRRDISLIKTAKMAE